MPKMAFSLETKNNIGFTKAWKMPIALHLQEVWLSSGRKRYICV